MWARTPTPAYVRQAAFIARGPAACMVSTGRLAAFMASGPAACVAQARRVRGELARCVRGEQPRCPLSRPAAGSVQGGPSVCRTWRVAVAASRARPRAAHCMRRDRPHLQRPVVVLCAGRPKCVPHPAPCDRCDPSTPACRSRDATSPACPPKCVLHPVRRDRREPSRPSYIQAANYYIQQHTESITDYMRNLHPACSQILNDYIQLHAGYIRITFSHDSGCI